MDRIDFSKYRIEFPKAPKVCKIKGPRNRYYKRRRREMRKGIF